MNTSWVRLVRSAILGLLATASVGCSDPRYAVNVVVDQLAVLFRSRPIDSVLDSGSLSDERRAKLLFLLDVRDYAIHTLNLNVGDSYTTYLDTGGEPVAYNLSACAKDSFTPYTWTFPVAGTIPYLGFFDRATAVEYQNKLVAQGYDTVVYAVDAYSTLGVFADPVTTNMLDRPADYLADLIIHESTHNTIWRNGDFDFNENLATFVARVGALQYLRERYGPDSPELADAVTRYHDLDLYNGFLTDLYRRLLTLYNSDITRDEKLAARATEFDQARQRFGDEVLPQMIEPDGFQWVLDLKFNNAWLRLNARYNNDASAFQAVYDAVGGDFARSLQIFREAAGADDPIAYLLDAAATAGAAP